MAPTLGYWDVRGLCTPIRLIFEYVNEAYEEKLYKCGPPPTFDRGEWLSDKFNLGLDFPNLPYLIDGDVKLTQSATILRYLAAKHGLEGKTDADKRRVNLLVEQVRDYHMEYARICYNPEFNTLKVDYSKGVPDKMKLLEKFMTGHNFVAGDYVTFADFVLFEYLEGQLYFNKDILTDFPLLEQFHKRVGGLEAVERYFKSDKAIKYPFNGAPAMFGGQYSEQLNK